MKIAIPSTNFLILFYHLVTSLDHFTPVSGFHHPNCIEQRRRRNFQTLFSSSSSSDDDDDYSSKMKHIKEEVKTKHLMEYDWKTNDNNAKEIMMEEVTMHTAVCIVPPDEAWDTIQRARHMARDHALFRWPPAIRLFHPFAPRPYLASAATAIADLIEQHQIQPFRVTLDQLIILPHWEKLEDESYRTAPTLDDNDDDDYEYYENEEQKEVRQLIENEALKGRQRLKQRRIRLGQNPDDDDEPSSPPTPVSPYRQMKREQQSPYAYNGPCVICLEPDASSRQTLHKLRRLFQTKLFDCFDPFSISSSQSSQRKLPFVVSNKNPNPSPSQKFRPLIPLASFPTVASAVKVAKRIQSSWEPLEFNVTDIHLISREGEDEILTTTTIAGVQERDASTDEIKSLGLDGRMGCDALVMLWGAEQEEEEEEDMRDLMMEEGEDCDMDCFERIFSEKEEQAKRDAKQMMENEEEEYWGSGGSGGEFLEEDEEDWNEGATIVIGRTQFFLGEMREYVGMPAYPIDGKDRVLGQGVSGAARRKYAVHRQGNRWQSGDYGSKDKDYIA